MNYEIEFAEEAIEDLSFLSVYEIQFTFSPDLAQDRIDKLMESVDHALSTFPARNPEKPYVFTEALCRCSGYEGQLRGIMNFVNYKKQKESDNNEVCE